MELFQNAVYAHLVLLKKNHLPEKNLETSFEKACLYLKIYKGNDSHYFYWPTQISASFTIALSV